MAVFSANYAPFLAQIPYIANRLKNDYSQCPDMWQKIQLIVIKIMSLGYTLCDNLQQYVICITPKCFYLVNPWLWCLFSIMIMFENEHFDLFLDTEENAWKPKTLS
ncbi:hypothetical protein [Symbiopectobacterium sp. RP]|uniref:hypothetical protein n=1 Tax=Symbiopectobacterium sp. RP TaxID=3248553 RepID=UPI003D2A1F14